MVSERGDQSDSETNMGAQNKQPLVDLKWSDMVFPPFFQWLFLVPLIGGR